MSTFDLTSASFHPVFFRWKKKIPKVWDWGTRPAKNPTWWLVVLRTDVSTGADLTESPESKIQAPSTTHTHTHGTVLHQHQREMIHLFSQTNLLPVFLLLLLFLVIPVVYKYLLECFLWIFKEFIVQESRDFLGTFSKHHSQPDGIWTCDPMTILPVFLGPATTDQPTTV